VEPAPPAAAAAPASGADAAVPAGTAPAAAAGLDETAIEDWVAKRLAARKNKDFKEADRIRDLLAAEGVILEDRPGGRTEWRRA
jgi:cysteinyl-tRNA synthetase